MVQSQRTQDSGVTEENNEITEGKIHCRETGGVAGEQTGRLDSRPLRCNKSRGASWVVMSGRHSLGTSSKGKVREKCPVTENKIFLFFFYKSEKTALQTSLFSAQFSRVQAPFLFVKKKVLKACFHADTCSEQWHNKIRWVEAEDSSDFSAGGERVWLFDPANQRQFYLFCPSFSETHPMFNVLTRLEKEEGLWIMFLPSEYDGAKMEEDEMKCCGEKTKKQKPDLEREPGTIRKWVQRREW